jgi:hypothetical protein
MSADREPAESDALFVTIGTHADGCLIFRPVRRERPQATDYWDGNWLITDLLLSVKGFEARIQATLVTTDFLLFCEQIENLVMDPSGTATFITMEEWVALTITGDGRGHFHAQGRIADAPGGANELRFRLAFDQTLLQPMLRDLKAICARFPVLGDPAV